MTSLRHCPKVSGFFSWEVNLRKIWNNLVIDLFLDFKDASCLVFGLILLAKDEAQMTSLRHCPKGTGFFSEGVNLGKYEIIWFLISNSTSKTRHG
jgi:hypothetical protein